MTIEELKARMKEAKRIVFFGGAGVSTDSGIPDFRSNGGLYQSDESFQEEPETMLHHDYFMKHPEKFYTYYKKHMIYPNAKPNGAHLALAELERRGKLTAVVTQNIDGLHQMAGNTKVLELHGTTLKNYCIHCGKEYSLEYVMNAEGVPYCEKCGNIVRPDVVLYGEGLPEDAFYAAKHEIMKADMLIIGGTSLTVHPAASLIGYYEGNAGLIIINKSRTPYDRYADAVFHESLAGVLESVITD